MLPGDKVGATRSRPASPVRRDSASFENTSEACHWIVYLSSTIYSEVRKHTYFQKCERSLLALPNIPAIYRRDFMKPFEKGSTVKLTDRYAITLEKARGNPNWVGRLGTVICCNRFSVSILWEGRMSVDHVPHKAVELALTPGI